VCEGVAVSKEVLNSRGHTGEAGPSWSWDFDRTERRRQCIDKWLKV
jgi:hypothetical protein